MYNVTPQSSKGTLAVVAHHQPVVTDRMQWLRSITFGLSAVVVVLLLVGTASAQLAERRVALVIGNGKYYQVPRLANPTSDARLMAETLTAAGFTLVGGTAQLDLDKPAFDRTVQEFSTAIQGAGVALFYYAGHGVQVRVNANPTREADVDFQMLNTDLVLRQMELAGTRLNLLILDACRNNPFAGRGLRAAAGGLAQMQAPEGTLISYATQPGNVAQDGTDGHSPYSKALASAFRKPGLDLFAVFNETGLEVKKRTGGAQQPWVSSSPIAVQFYFAGAAAQRPPTAPAETPQGSALSVTSPQPPSPPPNVANAEERGKAVAQDKQEVAQTSPPQAKASETTTTQKVIKLPQGGLGTIAVQGTIDHVDILDQQTGKEMGTWNVIIKKPVQVPVGTFKLKFPNFEVKGIEVARGENKVIDVDTLVGWISIPKSQDHVDILDQQTGKEMGTWNVIIKKPVQVPVGTYRLKFPNFTVDNVVVEAGQKVAIE